MHRDRHVGGLSFQCRAHDGGVNRRQLVGVIATRLRLLALIRIAHHGPGGVIKLQVAAACVIKSADRLAPRSSDIREKLIDVRVDFLAHQRAPLPEMKGAGSGDAHLRDDPAMRLQKLEVFDLPGNLDSLVLRLDTVKLNSCGGGDRFDTLETAEEIKMPPGAAEFTIGCKFQSDFFLLPDDLFDLAVFNRHQCSGIDFVPRPLGARLLEWSGSQQAADVVGAKRRSLALCHVLIASPTLRRPAPRSCGVWPTARPRQAHCPPLSKRNRIAETDRADRVQHIWWPLRSAFSLQRAARGARSSM